MSNFYKIYIDINESFNYYLVAFMNVKSRMFNCWFINSKFYLKIFVLCLLCILYLITFYDSVYTMLWMIHSFGWIILFIFKLLFVTNY